MNAFYPLLFTPLHNLYSILASLIVVGLLCGYVAKQLHLPSITGNIIGGILLGPVFGLVNVTSPYMAAQVEPFANFAFSLIAISIGSHLKFRSLHNSVKRIVVIACVQAIVLPLFCFVGILLAQMVWGTKAHAFEIAAVLSLFSIATAPATVVHIVKESQAKGIFVKTLLAVVVLNNVSNLVVFEVAKEVVLGSSFSSGMSGVLFKVGGALALGVGVALFLIFFKNKVFSRRQEATFSFAALIIAFGLSVELELSSVITTLTVGVFLTNFSDRNPILEVFEDFEELVFALFFTLTGAHASFNHLNWVGVLCLTYIFFRFWGNLFCLYISGQLTPLPKRVYKYLGMSLLPQGGITVGLLVTLETLAPYLSELIPSVILLSVTITEIIGPILLRLSLKQSGEAGAKGLRMGDFLQEEFISLSIKAFNKEEVLKQLVDFLFKTHNISKGDKEAFLSLVIDKERESSTGIGKGLSIPHGYIDTLDKTKAVMAVLPKPLYWDSIDEVPVEVVILLASARKNTQHHLQVLSAIAGYFLKKKEVREALKACKNAGEVYELITEENLSLHQLVSEKSC